MKKLEKIQKMIETIRNYGSAIEEEVLLTMQIVPREKFVDENPFGNHPVAIGYGQTISQPFIVAYMTHKLNLKPNHKVLEIGTGSGYQTAILSILCESVYTVERLKELSVKAQKILESLEYNNIQFAIEDGHDGWEEHAPYDRIMVTATAKGVPMNLLRQLKVNGKMILPIEIPNGKEQLIIVTKKDSDCLYEQEDLILVRFVPLVHGTSLKYLQKE